MLEVGTVESFPEFCSKPFGDIQDQACPVIGSSRTALLLLDGQPPDLPVAGIALDLPDGADFNDPVTSMGRQPRRLHVKGNDFACSNHRPAISGSGWLQLSTPS